jgi:recombination protein RecT
MAKGPRTDGNGQIVKRDKDPETQLRGTIMRMKEQIAMAIPAQIGVDRFLRTTMTAVTQVPELAICTLGSVIVCVLSAAQLGLMPNTPLGHCWLIPRLMKQKGRRDKVWTCTLMTGYKGELVLARRSGMVSGVRGVLVHEGDEWDWEEGTSPHIEHHPSKDPDRYKQQVTHGYGTVKISGEEDRHFEVLSFAEIELRRKAGGNREFSPWTNWWGPMAKKTCVRQALKLVPFDADDHLVRAQALEAAGMGQQPLAEAIDEQVADAIREQGIELDEVEPEEPTAPQATTTQGLTDEEKAAGYELTEEGEMVPPPAEKGGEA